ncbi:MAG: 2-oxo acid dehydrogenase subunit E2, partial [Oscillospiraceae bacterium]|nr:2-oxo acid dehydrogenase subunit E2 [Oscillospiraceae bacterium]
PNRCDNEAFISERIDLTNINAYLEEKNRDIGDKYKYNMFQIIVTAVVKAVTLRPKMNRFIANRNLYQRNEVSAAFVVKKQFTDSAEEALAFLHMKDEDTLDSIHGQIEKIITQSRAGEGDSSTESMDFLSKLPRWLTKLLVDIIRFLDVHGKVPNFLIATDPYYASVVLTNLGSIKLKSGYHHLTNWGTNSLFVAIGERKIRPFFDEQGNMTMRDSVDLGLTIDERLADGYYYSKTVRLVKKLLENPQLLELPLNEEVEY